MTVKEFLRNYTPRTIKVVVLPSRQRETLRQRDVIAKYGNYKLISCTDTYGVFELEVEHDKA